ncbi:MULTISPECIES: hypothetical protein [Clostridium]|uniref:Hypothetical integral membrane protein n=1 Tax=Clostridium butyricum E4 str. BoNT E BL5262 TaxID=632245 RepID=C4IBA2_CLOBU|nr:MULTISPECIES: hypothetical protein [Clostridium]EDT77130.1 hypothetical integral membrane protein [Clostridium butyricum 5521]EEP56111.1 hypothetical integral membrane protein [Clostridium butyricum E4 str. BoNT E BL5262]NFL33152.1 hypothetical protein [Clostridium butyricum]NFS19042.1 hypothetical protein [Clostridium butyricum]QUF85244.1 hypothetical protein KDJ93_19480 [Clostridium butyricum]
MPRNKKEGIIFGITMCVIMVFFMGMLNISIHHGVFDGEVMIICLKAFPVTFIVAFIIEGAIVGKVNGMLLEKFCGEKDSVNARILFNCFFIVTCMSLIMTFIGGMLGGDSLSLVTKEFFIRWPRNFCAAFFLNILVAGPVSRAILRMIQRSADAKKNAVAGA